ncbi:hypothetical protein [Alcaligenes sp. Marseille-Q7550]
MADWQILQQVLARLQQMQQDRSRIIVDGRAITDGTGCDLFYTGTAVADALRGLDENKKEGRR